MVRMFTIALVLALATPAVAAVAVPAPDARYASQPFAKAFPLLNKRIDRTAARSTSGDYRFQDGVLHYQKHYGDMYDAEYVFVFEKPGMSQEEARAVLRALQAETLHQTRATASEVHFSGTVWPATGEATATGMIRLKAGKAYEVRYHQVQSAE